MENVKELIDGDYENQRKWIEEHYPDHIFLAHTGIDLGTLIIGLEDEISDYIDFPHDHALGELIYDDTKKEALQRIDQINNGAKLTKEEKEVLRTHIIEEELNNFGGNGTINYCNYINVTFGETKLFSVYYGLIEGQGGYNPAFIGIFESLEVAKAELECRGQFI